MKKFLKKLFKKKNKSHFYPTDVWREIAEKYDIKNKLWNFVKNEMPDEVGSGFVLYGEIYGKGIQKGYDYGLDEIKFVGFDAMWDGEYLPTLLTKMVVEDDLELPHVDILYVGQWNKEKQDKYVFNNFINETKVPHEGIVVKHISGERNKISKVINPDYLIYSEKHDIGDSH